MHCHMLKIQDGVAIVEKLNCRMGRGFIGYPKGRNGDIKLIN